jgi:hypothetical protein
MQAFAGDMSLEPLPQLTLFRALTCDYLPETQALCGKRVQRRMATRDRPHPQSQTLQIQMRYEQIGQHDGNDHSRPHQDEVVLR